MAFGGGDFDVDNDALIPGIATDVTAIKTYLSGEGIQLIPSFSNTGNVEEGQYAYFAIYLNDVATGAITSANINITAISAVLSKSTGGGAFSAVGITQPTFAKANGVVYVNYQFLVAEWELGDAYRLEVSGIVVTIGSDTMTVPTHSWVASITEQVNVEGKIDAIQTDLGNPSARTNLQSILAILGNPDTAGKTTYEAIKNIRETAIDGSSTPTTNTLSDTLHKDGSYTYDNTTDSLEALRDTLDAVRHRVFSTSTDSLRLASLAFTNVAADKDFPNIVIPADFVPTGATILHLYLWVLAEGRKDSSGSANAINGASKAIRIKVSTGAWGTNDVVGITAVDNDWATDASSWGGSIILKGTADIKSIASTPANLNGKTFNVRSEQTTRTDAILVDGDALTLYGVDCLLLCDYTV